MTKYAVLSAVLALIPVSLSAEILPDLVLTGDETIEVTEGETRYGMLGGAGHTLTKTGAGKLVFTCVSNDTVAIVVQGGTIAFELEDAAAAAAAACVHFDASDATAMDFVSENGTNYVTAWRDETGSCTATVSSATVAWLPAAEKRRPWLRTVWQNGLPVVDFGAFQVPSFTNETGATLGYGGAFDLKPRRTDILEAIVVGAETEELKAVRTNYPQVTAADRAAPFLGDTSEYHFLRGDHSTVFYPEVVHPNPNARANSGALYLNNISVPPTTTKSPGVCHILDFVPDSAKPLTVGTLARERSFAFGGKRISEVFLYASALDASARNALYRHLVGKWFPAKVRSLTLADGTSVSVGSGMNFEPTSLTVTGAATVSGEGGFKPAEVGGEGLITYAKQNVAYDASTGAAAVAFPNGVVYSAAEDAYQQYAQWGGCFEKTGVGTLTLAETDAGGGKLTVSEGTVVIDVLGNRASWFHVDPSDETTMTVAEEGDVAYATKINDVNGNGRSASNTRDFSGLKWLRSAASRRPQLRRRAQNNHTVIDFGMPQVATLVDENGAGLGYGAAMDWSESLATAREILCVAGYHESVKSLRTDYPQVTSTEKATMFVGDANNYDFLGGDFSSTGKDWPYLLFSNPNARAHKGVILIDGVAMPTNASGYLSQRYPEGVHLMHAICDQDLRVGTFARDRLSSFGGVILGETLVFDKHLSALTRNRTDAALQVKWLASSDYPSYAYSDVSVAAGATLSLPYAELSVSGSLVPDGEVSVGRLALADGAEVVVNRSVPEGTEVRLVSCGAIAADLAKVTVSGAAVAHGAIKLKARSDGLYAKATGGLIIIFR